VSATQRITKATWESIPDPETFTGNSIASDCHRFTNRHADKVASIWNLCTVDEYRLRRVATTLVHHMLTEADEQGYPLKVLYSTPHAYHLFNRFDFEMFTQRQWFLPPGLDYEEW
jgi:predicted acetyltransferase